MTQKEFEDRTHRVVKQEDYYLIENLYMAAGNMNKDDFCREFKSMCAYDASNDEIELRQCLREIGKHIGSINAKNSTLKMDMKTRNDELADFLIGKSRAYNDTDFRTEAIRLVGEKEVVLRTVRMGLPLWDEDKQFIESYLSR